MSDKYVIIKMENDRPSFFGKDGKIMFFVEAELPTAHLVAEAFEGKVVPVTRSVLEKLKVQRKIVCRHCKDICVAYTCPTCKTKVLDQCRTCHKEVEHGRITPQFIRPHFGGHPPYKKKIDFEGDYGNENAIRHLEDG